jgi:hypothetical protein
MSHFRVAKLNRSHCNDAEVFVEAPFNDGNVATAVANIYNQRHYTDPDHYYAVVDAQYFLKNQPHITAADMAEAEMDHLMAYGAIDQ